MDKEKIIKLYTLENKSTYEIAEICNTYPNKIRRVLISNGIEIKTKSEAQKNALKQGKSKIPTEGRVRSKEEKLKISLSLSKKWANISDEDYELRVKSAKERWNKLSDKKKHSMSEAAIKAIQLAGKEGSKLEKFLRDELGKHGHSIEIHKKNLIQNQNLEIDMYFPKLKTIIEIDGPSHFLPIWGEEKLQKQIKADLDKNGLILSKGFVIIRVKNLSDSLSLSGQEKLKNTLIELLNNIKTEFPKESKRYIEIET